MNRSEEQQLQLLNGMGWDSDNDDDVDDVAEKWEKIKQPELSAESWEDLTDDKRESTCNVFWVTHKVTLLV